MAWDVHIREDMKTARVELTAEQTKDRETIIAKVRAIMVGQHSGRIAQAQSDYQWLMGWCDAKGYDFGECYSGALRHLQRTACGRLDTAALAGAGP